MYPVEGIPTDGAIFERKLIREIETHLTKQQVSIIATLLPNAVLTLSADKDHPSKDMVGVLLLADISGFTALCEKYAESGKGGIYKLTATLNGYIGAMVEVIYFYGGDVLKFSGDAILAAWDLDKNQLMNAAIDQVVNCAFYLQDALGAFQTELGITLKVKTAISCGNLTFAIIGDPPSQFYVTIGPPILEMKVAEKSAKAGDIILSSSAWGHCNPERYEHIVLPTGMVKVTKLVYKSHEINAKRDHEGKILKLGTLCNYHLEHSTLLKRRNTLEDVDDQTINAEFVSQLPTRQLLKVAVENYTSKSLRPFIIKPVMQQIDERQPLEFLTEMRDVTIMFVNIIPMGMNDLLRLTNEAIVVVCNVVMKQLGCVNKISLFDKDIMMLVVFGLRGVKHELESQNALKSGYAIRKELMESVLIKSVSVGVTSGFVYCGVVGHPLRREYTVIGSPVNCAARLMCAYENKVSCDQKSYKYSKLSSCYFSLQKPIQLKGIQNIGNVFEYNEQFRKMSFGAGILHPIVGRDIELTLVKYVLENAVKRGCYESLVFMGESKIGKTRLVKEIIKMAKKMDCITAFYFGNTQKVLTPFTATFHIFQEIYNCQHQLELNRLHKYQENQNDVIPMGKQPSAYWTFKDLLNVDQLSKNNFANIEKFKHEQVLDLFLTIISQTKIPIVIIIDDLQYCDVNSVKILCDLIKNDRLLVLATVTTEREVPGFIQKLLSDSKFQMHTLAGIDTEFVAALACQFLRVHGIPKKLETLLEMSSDGRPGWIQSCLLRLINNGNIEIIKITHKVKQVDAKTVFPDISLIDFPDLPSEEGDDVIPMAILGAKFTMKEGDKTLDEITLDLFDSFSPYQQLLLKTGAVLGDTFTSFMLKQLMQNTPLIFFLQAVRRMFEEQILECEVKNLKTNEYAFVNVLESSDLSSNRRKSSLDELCYCYFGENNLDSGILMRYQMPKYAFCRFIRFKNNYLRKVAYGLLPNNQKRRMHSQIINIIESQKKVCSNCTPTSTIFRLPKLNEYLKDLGLHLDNFDTLEPDLEGPKVVNFNDLKNTIRNSLDQSEMDLLVEEEEVTPIWNPENCSCGPILARVYYQLIKHSTAAENSGKRIYFLIQLGTILIVLNEYTQALKYLIQASELCISERSLSPIFSKIMFSKIHALIGRSHLEMNELNAADIHLCIALRQHNIPITATRGCMLKCLKLPWGYEWFNEKYPIFRKHRESRMDGELGNCLFLYSTLLNLRGQYEGAKICITRAIFILKRNNFNLGMLWDAYANAIDICKFHDKENMCYLLEKSANRTILEKYCGNDTLQLLSFGKLLLQCCSVRILKGELSDGIRIGYRALELNTKIHAKPVILNTLSLMVLALTMVHRIDEAVAQIEMIYGLREGKFDEATITYHTLSLVFYLQTSYILEKIPNCIKFAEKYFYNKVLRSAHYMRSEKLYLSALILYYCRIHDWVKMHSWEVFLKMHVSDIKSEMVSFHFILTVAMHIETLLLKIVHQIDINPELPEIAETHLKLKKIFKILAGSVKLWIMLLPRYYLYKAYYKKICGKQMMAKKYVRRGMFYAKQHENLLDYALLTKCRWLWFNDHSQTDQFIAKKAGVKCVGWKVARTQSLQEWQSVLYSFYAPLPRC